jgi:hypothetical protein
MFIPGVEKLDMFSRLESVLKRLKDVTIPLLQSQKPGASGTEMGPISCWGLWPL